MNVAAIREALAENLSALTGLQVSPYLLSNPTPPCAMVFADEIEYDLAFRGGAHALNFIVRVIVPFAGGDIGSQVSLDEYRAGARSIKGAIEAVSDLGGTVHDLRVKSVSADTLYGNQQGTLVGVGCEFRVYVLASD